MFILYSVRKAQVKITKVPAYLINLIYIVIEIISDCNIKYFLIFISIKLMITMSASLVNNGVM